MLAHKEAARVERLELLDTARFEALRIAATPPDHKHWTSRLAEKAFRDAPPPAAKEPGSEEEVLNAAPSLGGDAHQGTVMEMHARQKEQEVMSRRERLEAGTHTEHDTASAAEDAVESASELFASVFHRPFFAGNGGVQIKDGDRSRPATASSAGRDSSRGGSSGWNAASSAPTRHPTPAFGVDDSIVEVGGYIISKSSLGIASHLPRPPSRYAPATPTTGPPQRPPMSARVGGRYADRDWAASPPKRRSLAADGSEYIAQNLWSAPSATRQRCIPSHTR